MRFWVGFGSDSNIKQGADAVYNILKVWVWVRVRSKKKYSKGSGARKNHIIVHFSLQLAISSNGERIWFEKLTVRVGVRFRLDIRKWCGCSSKLIIGAVVGAGAVRKFILVRLRLQVGYTTSFVLMRLRVRMGLKINIMKL